MRPWFGRSTWVFHLNSGSCNGCDIEVLNIFAPTQDAERLGIKLVGSPLHADVIVFTGPVTFQALPYVIEALKAVPNPKAVVACGSCACGGGIWHDSYNVVGGIDALYEALESLGIPRPPTIYVPGCPPKPEAIMYGVLLARGAVKQKQRRETYVEEAEEGERLRDAEEVVAKAVKAFGTRQPRRRGDGP